MFENPMSFLNKQFFNSPIFKKHYLDYLSHYSSEKFIQQPQAHQDQPGPTPGDHTQISNCTCTGEHSEPNRKRARVPSMLTVVVLGGLSLTLYVLGLDLPFVLGVVSSSMLLVFPVALVSPRTDYSQRMSEGNAPNARVNCPNCGASNPVESEVRPLRLKCIGCESTLRLE